jgi:hypothetical protein
LRQVLGERPVTDEPEHIVVNRSLIRTDDEIEGSLVTALSFP